MSTWIWVIVLIAAVWAAHWGAEHLSEPLKKLRRKWGISVAAGGALIGLTAASPEVGIATTAALRGVSDIGLGSSIGSNVIAIPIMVVTAYLATRKRKLGEDTDEDDAAGDDHENDETEHGDHEQHVEAKVLSVGAQAVTVQALPYLGLIALFAVLTLPAGWRGLQPIDAAILAVGYLVYAVQAIFRGREEGESVEWSKKELSLAAGGVAALVAGAFFTVLATENIVSGIGISKVVGGLFITAPMATLPEVFATWSVARSGQVTPAVTSVIGDHAVTLTLSFVPLALVTLPLENLPLFIINLSGVALVGLLYAAFAWWGGRGKEFSRWQVVALAAVAPLWVVVVVLWGL